MNQPDNRPVGVPGGGRRFDASDPGAPRRVAPSPDAHGPGAPGPDEQGPDPHSPVLGRPGVANPGPGADQQSLETERLLVGVEGDLESVEEKSTQEQVPVFDRIHTALADALARTADTGGSPAGGPPGA